MGQLRQGVQDPVGDGGREQQGLASRPSRPRAGRQVGHDAADVGPEPHVEHAVGLVENQGVDAFEAGDPAAEVIDEASRRRDDDVDAGGEGLRLRRHRGAPEDRRARQPGVIDEPLQVVLYLHHQLAGRPQDEHAGPRGPRRGVVPRLLEQAVEHRQQVGRGLAASRLRARDQVAPARHDREDGGLDRGGVGEAAVPDALREGRGQIQLVEGCRFRVDHRRRQGQLGRRGREVLRRRGGASCRTTGGAAPAPRSSPFCS